MSIDLIRMWHERARPQPTDENFNVQLGCHLEEVLEMLDSLGGQDEISDYALERLRVRMRLLSEGLKQRTVTLRITDRHEFLDSVADQVVTGIGTAHCARMDAVEALRRVNQSNWSKFVDGYPQFDANGKITKPDGYEPPDLKGLY